MYWHYVVKYYQISPQAVTTNDNANRHDLLLQFYANCRVFGAVSLVVNMRQVALQTSYQQTRDSQFFLRERAASIIHRIANP